MSFLKLEEVTKIYPNGTKAVDKTSLDIENGEFMVFVGPSGCGKSTLLRMIAGLEDITEGKIILDERAINKIDPSERDIAMVFQNYALYPHMNVYKNLAYGLKNRGETKLEIEKKVNIIALKSIILDIKNDSMIENTKPPINPSHVLFGLMYLANLILPNFFPVKYAPISIAQIRHKNANKY